MVDQNKEHIDRLMLSVDLVCQAGSLILKFLSTKTYGISYKNDHSPVTDADLAAEDFLRNRLSILCPNDSIKGEEFDVKTGSSGYTWHIDPIDGTKSFIHGVPLFGTLAGLEYGNTAIAGVILMPALSEIVYAATGYGSWWSTNISHGKVIDANIARVSHTPSLSESTVSTTDAQWISTSRQMQNLMGKAKTARSWGDCYGHYLVATGRIDGMVDPFTMNSWDCAPILPIVKEAGGKFTSVKGDETIHGGSAISSNGMIHQQILDTLSESN